MTSWLYKCWYAIGSLGNYSFLKQYRLEIRNSQKQARIDLKRAWTPKLEEMLNASKRDLD